MSPLPPPPIPSLAAVLSTSLDAVVVIEDTGEVVGWNGNAEQIFGYTVDEVYRRQVAEIIIPAHSRAAHSRGMNRYLEFGEVNFLGRRTKLSALHKNGHEFPVELAVMVYSGVGNRCFLGFIRDLTQEAVTAVKIEALNAEVIQLSRLNAMGTAASIIAHELNQPLAAASNYLDGCKRIASEAEGTLPANFVAGLGHAQEAIRRAAGVVKVVREVVATRPMLRTRVQVARLVGNSLKLIGSSLPVSPEIKLDFDAKYVSVNKSQIEQVLLNLLNNAVEATLGRPDPLLSCSSRKSGEAVEISIQDNGPGLSDEAQEHLFTPFKSSKTDGLGIGLSICRAIVEEHGGKIWANSNSLGTTFSFTVPAG